MFPFERQILTTRSLKDICDSLMADNILTGAGKEKWIPSTVHKILTNEKYIGDALLQKTVTTDFLEKKRQTNNGLAPQYYVEGSHEPIIPKHIFMRVQEELVRRANLRSGADGKKKRVYSSKYALSSICTCEKCGDVYRRIAWNNRGKKYTVWRCCNRLRGAISGYRCKNGKIAIEIGKPKYQKTRVGRFEQGCKCSSRRESAYYG